jgi:uncharacterized membrane protein (UPF0127 family)
VAHFLSPLVSAAAAGEFLLRHERTGQPIASVLETAFDAKSRNRGLLGRDGLASDAALILAPCASIHTFFMRFAIDVLFVRKDGTVAKVRERIVPMRAACALGGFAAIELVAGRVAIVGVRAGDRLLLERRA